MTFTRERLQKLIRAIDSESYDEEEIVGWVNSDEILELARMALAAQEAEPVGEVVLGEYDDSGCHPDARVVCIAADGQADWENFRDGTRLYAAPPAPVSVPDEKPMPNTLSMYAMDAVAVIAEVRGWNACRAAMLQGDDPVQTGLTLREGLAAIRNSGIAIDAEKIQAERDALNAPEVPDGYALVPMKLTAENGAKGALLGEFSETKFINCPECFGDDECETCDGSGRLKITVPVSWTTIKAIWAKGVEHFSAAPQQEA